MNKNKLKSLGNLTVLFYDSDYCRIYCRSPVSPKSLYCIQEYQAHVERNLALCICTEEGEPMYTVHNHFTFGEKEFSKKQVENFGIWKLKELYKKSKPRTKRDG